MARSLTTRELAQAVRQDLVIARDMERLGLLRPWLYALALGQPGREELACALRQGPVHGRMAPIEVDADPRGGSFTIMPGEAARALLLDESRGLSGRMNRPGQGLARRLGADRSSSWLQILARAAAAVAPVPRTAPPTLRRAAALGVAAFDYARAREASKGPAADGGGDTAVGALERHVLALVAAKYAAAAKDEEDEVPAPAEDGDARGARASAAEERWTITTPFEVAAAAPAAWAEPEAAEAPAPAPAAPAAPAGGAANLARAGLADFASLCDLTRLPVLTNKLARRAEKFGARAGAGLAASLFVPVLFLPVLASNVAHSVAGVDAVGCLDAIAALCVCRLLLAESGCDVDAVVHAVASGSSLLSGALPPPPPPTSSPPQRTSETRCAAPAAIIGCATAC